MTTKNNLPAGCEPGRGRKGVTTEWGERNAAFIAARKCARKGDQTGVEKAKAAMAAVQPVSAREEAAIAKAARSIR